jgi:hypothetical protein
MPNEHVPDLMADWGNSSYTYNHGIDDSGEYIVVFHSWRDLKHCAESIVETFEGTDYEASLSEGKFTNDISIVIPDNLDKDLAIHDIAALLEKMVHRANDTEDMKNYSFVEWVKDAVEFIDDKWTVNFGFDSFLGIRGWEMSFSDEYSMCGDCCCLIHTQVHFHGDIGRYQEIDGEYKCRACILRDPAEYIRWYKGELEAGNVQSFVLDPAETGLVEISEERPYIGKETYKSAITFESGLHRGQRDNPKKTAKFLLQKLKALKKHFHEDNDEDDETEAEGFYGFTITEPELSMSNYQLTEKDEELIDLFVFDVQPGQFDVRWTIWCHPAIHNFMLAWLTKDEEALKDKEGPGDYAEKALRGISTQQQARKPGEVFIANIDTANKTTTTGFVPQEQALDYLRKEVNATRSIRTEEEK